MGASQFVGRVGGLAVALGVGAALLSTSGVASADRGSAPDTRGSGSSSDSASPSTGPGARGSAGRTAPSPAAAVVAQQTHSSRSSALTVDEPVSAPAVAPAAAAPAPLAASAVAPAASAAAVSAPAPVQAAEAVDPEPVVAEVAEPVAVADPAPEEAPAGEVVAYSAAGSATDAGGAGSDPSAPVGHPIVDLLLASFIRRETTSAASTASQTASATSGLTFAPVTTYFDGVLQGNLNVTSSSGCGDLGSDCKLKFSFEGSSDGGKADFNDVPAGLPGGGPLINGTNGSYTFLPYAKWINPASPTKFPTPTGTQDFTVRVTENTKFDQTITGIPLIGLLAGPIIGLLQKTPFLGNLLAPIIGSTAAETVSVNVGSLVPNGKQVAYTIMVTSFDGVNISTNFFPASQGSLLPALGNQQATIFNGPGLGGAGTTKPYELFGAAGAVPGMPLMRGQGYPAPFNTAPLGFNVVTWDPRGEWASGGILQLDNPFYEGRDVTALIDWADANTPLLNETPGVPDVAMMGGSYGGGIQLTTVDPRIRVVVPSIAWNSLNQSLYPTDVFKTGWANTLALALLGTGASSLDRVNSQITQALVTGNLFGFISETAQAVLSSSGPTTLLTKLSIPTMYDQGIVDGLFPLQQSIENAQTQLEQNPFFAGANQALVKLLWFCGGHGICDHLTPAQQQKQATLMFLENLVWANNYAKDYIKPYLTVPSPPAPVPGIPIVNLIAPFTWWDQHGTSWIAPEMPWTPAFNTGSLTGGNLVGGRINSFTSKSGPRTGCAAGDTSGQCSFPFDQTFATPATNAVEALIPIPAGVDPVFPSAFVVGAPKVSFSYSGTGNAKAVYAQVIDTTTGKVLGNINTPIPVTLDGKTHTVTDFEIADIVYSGPLSGQPASSLKLQIVANSSAYKNNAVIWSVDISDLSVTVPTTTNAFPNPLAAFVP